MIGSLLVLIASRTLSVLVCMCACLLIAPQSAKSESKIVIHERFIPKSYNWDAIRRIAILPIGHEKQAAVAPGTKRKWTQQRPFPSDSLIQPLVSEMVRQIKRLDSTIVVLLIDPLKSTIPQPLIIKVAGGATGADAVMEIVVSSVIYLEATPDSPGPFVNGKQMPPIAGKPAATRVRMSFTLTDSKTGGLIWLIDVEGKESRGAVGGSPDEADPPGPEGLIKDLTISAASWLPFSQSQN